MAACESTRITILEPSLSRRRCPQPASTQANTSPSKLLESRPAVERARTLTPKANQQQGQKQATIRLLSPEGHGVSK
ncbi:hypothetical protein O3M35_001831 [Rhynocoris fuscipes]|uniref:Uncharacterized protein n=1 Tax=Rhynocoris fuscipes TaxID=488301 RepID=A0AAW1CVH6_9HEMI